jgi:hypothetical protein
LQYQQHPDSRFFQSFDNIWDLSDNCVAYDNWLLAGDDVKYNFEWDPDKAKSNAIKHGVRFEDALLVFLDPKALTIFDEDHSHNEDRWITMGLANTIGLCVVHHTFRDTSTGQTIIRIISARKASRNEHLQYAGEK